VHVHHKQTISGAFPSGQTRCFYALGIGQIPGPRDTLRNHHQHHPPCLLNFLLPYEGYHLSQRCLHNVSGHRIRHRLQLTMQLNGSGSASTSSLGPLSELHHITAMRLPMRSVRNTSWLTGAKSHQAHQACEVSFGIHINFHARLVLLSRSRVPSPSSARLKRSPV